MPSTCRPRKNGCWPSARYPEGFGGDHFIGAYAMAVASGYDMLYNDLTPAERSQLSGHLAAIVQRGVKGTTTDWWGRIYLCHDHWLPIAGLGVGAAALYYENESGPAWLTYFRGHPEKGHEHLRA